MKSLSLQSPHIIVMVGLPGSGKSFFAERFSETFSVPVVSWDAIRELLFSEVTYSKEDDAIVEQVAWAMLDQLCKTSAALIYEGDSLTQASRIDLTRRMKKLGYEPLFVWVQTDLATTKARALKKNVPSSVFEAERKRFTPLKESDPYVVISGKHNYASQLKIVLRRLSSARAAATNKVPATASVKSSARPPLVNPVRVRVGSRKPRT